ncbi:hypothetical protein [Streptomyces sp. NPDC085659]|uniref:hypothetical protein n=1 Tax=Streptomyces sp. NPDC085659 TaxID=3155177 RepID=UPI00344F3A68
MSTYPKLTLADLTALADSYAQEPVLYVDTETGHLAVGSAAYVSHHLVVLTQQQLVDLFGTGSDEPVGEQWAALGEDYSREDALEQLEDEVNDGIEEILAEHSPS